MKSLSLLVAAALGLTGAVASAQSQGATPSDAGSYGSATGPTGAPSPNPSMPMTGTTGSPSVSGAGTSAAGADASGTTPSSSTATKSSTPILVESKVDLRTEPSAPEDLRAARQEAVNALHWAKTEGCRSEPSPRDCLRQAQEDYRQALARLGSDGSVRATTSASGTSAAAGDGRAPRSHRR